MASKVSVVASDDVMCEYIHPVLGSVCTLREAAYTWHKSETAIRTALYRQRVHGRKSFTGGDWLVSVASMLKVYGEPKENMLWDLQKSE